MRNLFDSSFNNSVASLISTERRMPSISDLIDSSALASIDNVLDRHLDVSRVLSAQLESERLLGRVSDLSEFVDQAERDRKQQLDSLLSVHSQIAARAFSRVDGSQFLSALSESERVLGQAADLAEFVVQAEHDRRRDLNRLLSLQAADAYSDLQAQVDTLSAALHGPIDLHRLFPTNNLADLLGDSVSGFAELQRGWMHSLNNAQSAWHQLTEAGQLHQTIRDLIDSPVTLLQAGIDELQKLTGRGFSTWEDLTTALDLEGDADAEPEVQPLGPVSATTGSAKRQRLLNVIVIVVTLAKFGYDASSFLQFLFGDNVLGRLRECFEAPPEFYVLNTGSALCSQPWQCAGADIIMDLPPGTAMRALRQSNGYVYVEAKLDQTLSRRGWVRLEHTDPVVSDVQADFKTQHFPNLPDDGSN